MTLTLSPELLADLKAKAEAAIKSGVDGQWFEMRAFRRIMNSYDAEFALAASPATILALLAKIRRKRGMSERPQIQKPCPWCREINCADTMHLILATQRDRPTLRPAPKNEQ